MDTTDSEDSPRPGSQSSGSGSRGSQLTVVGGSYSNLSPMIIMNNVLLKQVQLNLNFVTQIWPCRVQPSACWPQALFRSRQEKEFVFTAHSQLPGM